MNSFEKIYKLLTEFGMTFLEGIATTLILAIVGTVVGLFIGIGIALVRNMKIKENESKVVIFFKKSAQWLCAIYVTIFRGTPMMVQAMIIFFGVSSFGLSWSSIPSVGIFNGYLVCGLIVITINTGAYMTEIIRSGINGVGVDQYEGAFSLGMSYNQTMTRIILPQALKNSLPTILNEWIVNIKDSCVLNVIGLTELFATISIATGKNYFKIEGYIIVAVIYLILTLISTLVLKLVEKHLDGQKISFSFFHKKETV